MNISARIPEKKLLKSILTSEQSEFIAVYGRRRVGKTYLISNFYREKGFYFQITGVKDEKTDKQLWNFAQVYNDTFPDEHDISTPKSWQSAFHKLYHGIQRLKTDKRIIIFIDELPWFATRKSGFVPALTYIWNQYFSNDPRIIMIVCGSAATWMINNVINAKGGLYNRITRKLQLMPFSLKDTEEYLRNKNISLSRKQIIELYMAFGGIPSYLNYVQTGQSSAQVINNVCFSGKTGALYDEFDRLYHSLFSNAENHITISKKLHTCRQALNRSTLFAGTNITSSSVQNRILQELIESNFIEVVRPFGKLKKGSLYRGVDEYSAFYLKWKNEIKKSDSISMGNWLLLQQLQTWKSWSGFAFESICHKHIRQIAIALGISGIQYSFNSWRNHSSPTSGGAQIDLLIDRADNCVNICEIKFSNSRYILNAKDIQKIASKKEIFIEQTGTRKTVFITLITCNGVRENQAYNELINSNITSEALFQ